MPNANGTDHDGLDELLRAVARGEITPEAAAAALDEARSSKPESRHTTMQRDDLPVDHIEVQARRVSIAIAGDPAVATAFADGPHEVHHRGTGLVIAADDASEPRSSSGGFVYGRRTMNRESAAAIGRMVSAGIGAAFGTTGRSRLLADARRDAFRVLSGLTKDQTGGDTVHVFTNPTLPLRGHFSGAQPVTIEAISAPLTVSAIASTLSIDDVEGAFELDVSATIAYLSGPFSAGATITGKANTVVLHLDRDHSYRVTNDSTRTTVRLPEHARDHNGVAAITGTDGDESSIGIHLALGVSTVEIHHD